jgi:hypothetical protein
MRGSSRNGPRFSRGAPHINANGGIFNHVGGDQYNNYNNAMNDEMVVRQFYL